MADAFLGEIRIFSFAFAPQNWAFCNGALLSVAQNSALFTLLGANFGGDGVTNFALPDLRGRVPIHAGGTHTLGQAGGEQTHILTTAEVLPHTHVMYGSDTPAETNVPTGAFLAQVNNGYDSSGSLTALSPAAVATVGGQAHENMQPFLALNFCIALQGVYPSRS